MISGTDESTDVVCEGTAASAGLEDDEAGLAEVAMRKSNLLRRSGYFKPPSALRANAARGDNGQYALCGDNSGLNRHCYALSPDMSELLISEQNGYRTLHFGSEWVQGRMRISKPAELILGYAQDMCAGMLFAPPPKHVYVAGLGVGSLPRWGIANWAESLKRMEIVELRADVMALTRSAFPIPQDDERVVLTLGDAAKVITERPASSVDWMWVDCYDGRGRVGALESAEFYAAAHAALKAKGVFVGNMWSSVTRYRGGLRRLRAVFGDNNIVLLPAIATENVTVIACKSPLPDLASRALQARARALHAEYKLPFERWLKAIVPVSTAL